MLIFEFLLFSGLLLTYFFSLMGLYSNPFWITLKLLGIFNISETTYNVMRSITMNWNQLAMTFICCIFFIWSFSALIVTQFSSNFDDDHQGIYCDRLWPCFVYVVNYGFWMGGGIGDIMAFQEKTYSKYSELTILQIMFFVIVNVIFLNIIFGIIIDTFSLLRDEQKER